MKKYLFIVPLFISACVVNPYNNQMGGAPGESIYFSGFAINPSAPIKIQALDKSDGDWVAVGSAIAASSPTYTIDGYDLYKYSTTVTLNVSPGANNCFYGYTPAAGCIPQGNPQLRVYQPDISATYSTFEEGGMLCVLDALGDGDSLQDAIRDCKSPDSPVITMQWVW